MRLSKLQEGVVPVAEPSPLETLQYRRSGLVTDLPYGDAWLIGEAAERIAWFHEIIRCEPRDREEYDAAFGNVSDSRLRCPQLRGTSAWESLR